MFSNRHLKKHSQESFCSQTRQLAWE